MLRAVLRVSGADTAAEALGPESGRELPRTRASVASEGGETVFIPYGRELYPGESFFRTDKGFYNRAALSYAKHFFHDTVRVRVEFATHCDGTGFGTQQMLDVAVKFFKPVYNSKNHKK